MPEDTQEGQIEETQEVEETKEETQTEEQVEALSTSEEPTEAQEDEPELPEDAKERTKKEFEKLKQNNAELKRQLEESKKLPSVLDYFGGDVPQVSQETRQQYIQPPQVNMPVYNQPYQQPAPQPAPQLVDEQGYVNADVLSKRLELSENALRRAEEAERKALEAQQRIAKFEQDAETKALYQAYPELDPLNTEAFNREAYELVKNELTSQIVSTGKRNAIEAANKMSKYFRKQEPRKVLEQRNAVSSVSGKQPRQVDDRPIDQLSTAERLQRLGL